MKISLSSRFGRVLRVTVLLSIAATVLFGWQTVAKLRNIEITGPGFPSAAPTPRKSAKNQKKKPIKRNNLSPQTAGTGGLSEMPFP